MLFLGLVGMSVDIGLLMYRKAALQRAADAAALAGALDLAKVTPDTAAADASARFYISANEGGLDA
ncbi:MAG: hypothetical protein KC432_17315, partial [Thermomicrobiales bacterium]|nr:hypothetical protein [Thermomicrobiales bacterium]